MRRKAHRSPLLRAFAESHGLSMTGLLRREEGAIYWLLRGNRAVKEGLRDAANPLDQTDAVWAILLSMLDRTFEYAEGAIIAYTTGAMASSEIISRAVIESAISLVFIIADDRKGDRLSRYFAHYFNKEDREIDHWLKAASGLNAHDRAIQEQAAIEKRDGLKVQRRMLDESLAEIGLPTTAATGLANWPSVADRFKALNRELDYRTIYAALCSQTHNDAEDLLNYFFSKATDDKSLLEIVGLEAVTFSRMMLYFGLDYYLMAAASYALRLDLKESYDVIDGGRKDISAALREITRELEALERSQPSTS